MTASSVRGLAFAAVRFSALMLLLKCVEVLSVTFITFHNLKDFPGWILSFFGTLAAYVFVSFFLLVRTEKVVGWIMPKASYTVGSEESGDVDLFILGFSVAGLFFLVSGVASLIHLGVEWFIMPQDPFDAQRLTPNLNLPVMASSLFRAVAGAWLLVGSEGILKFIRWVRAPREAGTEREDRNLEE